MDKEKAEEISIIIGNNIKNYRVSRNLTVEQLAELSNSSPSYIGLLERGKRCPSIGKLITFSEIFNVKLDDLYNKENEGDENKSKSIKEKIVTIMNYLEQSDLLLLEAIVEAQMDLKKKND